MLVNLRYGLCVDISSKGQCSSSPLLSPLFQSQVGHSLMWKIASPLSFKLNCTHNDVTTASFCRGVRNKKAVILLTKMCKNTFIKFNCAKDFI